MVEYVRYNDISEVFSFSYDVTLRKPCALNAFEQMWQAWTSQQHFLNKTSFFATHCKYLIVLLNICQFWKVIHLCYVQALLGRLLCEDIWYLPAHTGNFCLYQHILLFAFTAVSSCVFVCEPERLSLITPPVNDLVNFPSNLWLGSRSSSMQIQFASEFSQQVRYTQDQRKCSFF